MDIQGIALSYHQLGTHLGRQGNSSAALPYYLAAGLIRLIVGLANLEDSMNGAATALSEHAEPHSGMTDITELCRQISKEPEIQLERALLRVAPNLQAAQRALNFLTSRVRTRATAPLRMAPILAAWDPAIAGLLIAEKGGAQAAEANNKLDEYLALQEQYSAPLVTAFRQIRAGQHDETMLPQQDITYAAVIRRALDALDGRVTIPEELGKAMPLSILLAMVVAAATGDKSGVATRVRQNLEAIRVRPSLVVLSRRLEQILDGDRDAGLSAGLDALDSAIVATVLTHVSAGSTGKMTIPQFPAQPHA